MVKRMLAFKSDGIIVYNRSVFVFTSLNYTLLSENPSKVITSMTFDLKHKYCNKSLKIITI